MLEPIVDELGRMQGQRGLFTWLDTHEFLDLDSYLTAMGDAKALTRLVLSPAAVGDGLMELRAHGIDERLLFPDIGGAARATNDRIPLNHLETRRSMRQVMEKIFGEPPRVRKGRQIT